MLYRYLVIYDIAHPRRLQRVARVMEGFGQRIQKSVFECELELRELQALQKKVLQCMHTAEDAVQYMRLCPRDTRQTQHDGQVTPFVSQAFFWV